MPENVLISGSFFIPFSTSKMVSQIDKKSVKNSIKIANELIKSQGRILVRKSGTEPKIRIMGESKNKVLLSKCIKIILRTIK